MADCQIWKTAADGSPSGIQVTKGGGFGAVESADGQFLYYSRTLVSSPIWRVPVLGGEELPLNEEVRSLRLPRNFAVGEQGIYFAGAPIPSGDSRSASILLPTGKSSLWRASRVASATASLSRPMANGSSFPWSAVRQISSW